jgi:hypothetical protein
MSESGEPRWNDIYRGNPKNYEKALSQCNYVHQKSHMGWPGREPGPPWNLKLILKPHIVKGFIFLEVTYFLKHVDQ